MKKTGKYLVGIGALMLLSACGNDNSTNQSDSMASSQTFKQMRWYQPQQVALGKKVFADNCASCHGADAAGAPNWRKADASGAFPAPPLNGSAHAWHHPKNMLRMTIRRGGIPLGGSMPPFADKLTDDEIDAVIAWIQSHWNDEIYTAWAKRNAQAAVRQENRK